MKFLEAFIPLDEFIFRISRPIPNLYCKITGKDNFSLAKGTLFLGVVLIWVGHLYNVILPDAGWWDRFSLVVICPIWTWFGHNKMKFFRQVEEAAKAESDTLNINLLDMQRYVIDRLFYSFWLILIIPGMLFLRPISWGFALYILAHHFLFHFNKGGKSIVRVLAEAAKKAGAKVAEKARDLVPQPQPIPVPIGA